MSKRVYKGYIPDYKVTTVLDLKELLDKYDDEDKLDIDIVYSEYSGEAMSVEINIYGLKNENN